MAQRLLRALSPFRKKSSSTQKAQDSATAEDGRKEPERRGFFSRRSYSLEERRRKDEEALRAQLSAGLQGVTANGNAAAKVEGVESRKGAERGDLEEGMGVGKEPGGLANGGPLQENGIRALRFEHGAVEGGQAQEPSGNISPVSPLETVPSNSSSPSLHEHKANDIASPPYDHASPPPKAARPLEGLMVSPHFGSPLRPSLSDLSSQVSSSPPPRLKSQNGGDGKSRMLARPLNVSVVSPIAREKGEMEDRKGVVQPQTASVSSEGARETQKPPLDAPADVEPAVRNSPLGDRFSDFAEGPTPLSPFRLTESPIYMPPPIKTRPNPTSRNGPDSHEDEIPWAKDSTRREWGASALGDKTLPNLSKNSLRPKSPDQAVAGTPTSPRFASPGGSPRGRSGSRSPRHAAPTRAIRGFKTPEKQPPRVRAPGSFSAPLVRRDLPTGGARASSPMARFMRDTASSKVKTAAPARERTQSVPRKRVTPTGEGKKGQQGEMLEGDKLLDFSTDFAAERRLREDELKASRKGKQVSTRARSSSPGDSRMLRSASFPTLGVTPAEMMELAALKAQLAKSLKPKPRTPLRSRSKTPPRDGLARSPLESPQRAVKKGGGVPPIEVSLVGGEDSPPAVPANVPLAAEEVFETPVNSPKSPLQVLLESGSKQTSSPRTKASSTPPSNDTARRSSSPQRKAPCSPKGPVQSKEDRSPTAVLAALAQTGPLSPVPRSPRIKKPPTVPKGKPLLEVDVPPRTPALLSSPGAWGSPRSSPSSGGSPASSPSKSPMATWTPAGSSLLSPTAASRSKAVPSPRGRSQSPSRLSRSQSVVAETAPVGRPPARTSSLPSNLERNSRSVRRGRSASPPRGSPAPRSESFLKAKKKPGMPKKEPMKRTRGLSAPNGDAASVGSSEGLVDLEQSTSLLNDEMSCSEGDPSEQELSFAGESRGQGPRKELALGKDTDGKDDVSDDVEKQTPGAESAEIHEAGMEAVKEAVKDVVKKVVKEEGKEATQAVHVEAEETKVEGEKQVAEVPAEGGSPEAVGSPDVDPPMESAAIPASSADVGVQLAPLEVTSPAVSETKGSKKSPVFEDDSLEVLPGLSPPRTNNRAFQLNEGGNHVDATTAAQSGGQAQPVAGRAGAPPSVETPGKDGQLALNEKEQRRLEVVNLLAALQEKEEIDYVARLIRQAQRQQRQTPPIARPEDEPPSLNSSIDSLASIKGGEIPGVSESATAQNTREGSSPGKAGAVAVLDLGTGVSRVEPVVEMTRVETVVPVGWGRIMGVSDGQDEAVWGGPAPSQEQPPEKSTEVVKSSWGVQRGQGTGGDSGAGRPEVEFPGFDELSAGPGLQAGGRVNAPARVGMEAAAKTEPSRRKEAASISMPEDSARGFADAPETADWDTHPSPTSPLEFSDGVQASARTVHQHAHKAMPGEGSPAAETSKRDLSKPAVYIETVLECAGLTAPEPHPLPKWFSQTQVLNPALFQELERHVNADLLPTLGEGHRKGATWRYSLDSTALRDQYSRRVVPQKDGYSVRKMLFDRVEEALGGILAPYKPPPLGKRKPRPLRRAPRGIDLVQEVVGRCREKLPGGVAGAEAGTPLGVEELLQRCLPLAQRKWDNFEVEETEVEVELELGILDDLICDAVQGLIALEQRKGSRRRIHPLGGN